MTLWLREILGWLLLGIALAVFLLCYQALQVRRVFDCIPLAFIGYTVFRGGLHLIKVATAARLAKTADTPPPANAPSKAVTTRSYAPSSNVIPGK
jgi:hypothetical protein